MSLIYIDMSVTSHLTCSCVMRPPTVWLNVGNEGIIVVLSQRVSVSIVHLKPLQPHSIVVMRSRCMLKLIFENII